MFKLGQLDFSPENLDHLPVSRRNFITFARDAIAKSSAPTLTTDVSMKFITQDGLDFITSDVGLQRSVVRAQLSEIYSAPEIETMAQSIIQQQIDADSAAGIATSPITPQQITDKVSEIQSLGGKISFDPNTGSYQFQSMERPFMLSSAAPLDVFSSPVDAPRARSYIRNNIQQSVNPANNQSVSFRNEYIGS